MLACAYVCQVLLTGDVVNSRSISGETGANHSLLKQLPISIRRKQMSSWAPVSQGGLILWDSVSEGQSWLAPILLSHEAVITKQMIAGDTDTRGVNVAVLHELPEQRALQTAAMLSLARLAQTSLAH